MQAQEYWNEIGSKKEFEDPLYLEKLRPHISPSSRIVEYGCGYGRMGNLLFESGYINYQGFDFAPKMIARGKQENPHLDLYVLEKSGSLPIESESVDAVIMATVLCCIVDTQEIAKILHEMGRVLKKGGVLYITDFLVSDDPLYEKKYNQGFRDFGEKGVYTTGENLVVRHYRSQVIMNLLSDFDIQWFEQFDFKTMNGNPARTFHSVAKKT